MMLTRLRHLEFNVPVVRGAMRNLFFPDARWTQIRWGPLRGMKIQNRADVNLHLLLGAWELRSFTLVQRALTLLHAESWQGAAFDIGANMGAYSFWLERALPAQDVIYAFEASPETAERLRRHLTASRARKVLVVQAACIEINRTVEFFLSHHHHSSSVVESFAHAQVATSQRASLRVQGIALDNFMSGVPHPVRFIKIDIEGGAVFALQGMKETIARHRPLILIESHTPDEDRAISQVLVTNTYEAFRLNTEKWVKHKTNNHTDRQGIWGTMLCVPKEHTRALDPLVRS